MKNPKRASLKTTERKMDIFVGQRIRMRRMQLKKSQEWLADALGLTFQQVQKYEKGMNRVGASRLQMVANALEVTPSFFFEGMPGARGTSQGAVRPDIINEELATRDGMALLTMFHDLADAQRATVLNLARDLNAMRNG